MTTVSPTRLHVRPLRRDETDLLDELVARLSPRSRYLRFHSPLPRLTAGVRRALLDVDQRDHIALVAETVDGRAVGIARCVRVAGPGGTTAEVAITVVDAWHRRGVGRRLVEALAERAAASGISRLTARVLPENPAALGLFRAVFPLTLTRWEDDALVLTVVLDGSSHWEITTEDILADLLS